MDWKRNIWLQPLLLSEINRTSEKSLHDLDRRLLHGGLPGSFLGNKPDDVFFSEWLDSFWAKDVQELFTVERKTSFLKLAELVLRQSGELFAASSFSAPCKIFRQTVINYLEILNTTLFVFILRPFKRGRANDIIRMPKLYAFDTGFICYARGWNSLRPEDAGQLLEHLVLNELVARIDRSYIYFWRDKQKHEIDFVFKTGRGSVVHTIECKSKAEEFGPSSLKIFREHSPEGKNFVVAKNITQTHVKRFNNLVVNMVSVWDFGDLLDDICDLSQGAPTDTQQKS